MIRSRLTQGLPYSAVLALLGWLMLSQGHPTVDVEPRASALTHEQAQACAERALDAGRVSVADARVLPAVPAVPEGAADNTECPAGADAQRR